MLVDRRSLDGEQEVPEVLAHALEGGRVGLTEQALLSGGLEGDDLVGVPLAGQSERDQDLAPVRRVDVAADPALLLQPGHPVGDRARGDLGAAQQRPRAQPLPGGAAQGQQYLEFPDLDALGRQFAAQLPLDVVGQPPQAYAQLLGDGVPDPSPARRAGYEDVGPVPDALGFRGGDAPRAPRRRSFSHYNSSTLKCFDAAML